jgi:hypothetical protein
MDATERIRTLLHVQKSATRYLCEAQTPTHGNGVDSAFQNKNTNPAQLIASIKNFTVRGSFEKSPFITGWIPSQRVATSRKRR